MKQATTFVTDGRCNHCLRMGALFKRQRSLRLRIVSIRLYSSCSQSSSSPSIRLCFKVSSNIVLLSLFLFRCVFELGCNCRIHDIPWSCLYIIQGLSECLLIASHAVVQQRLKQLKKNARNNISTISIAQGP